MFLYLCLVKFLIYKINFQLYLFVKNISILTVYYVSDMKNVMMNMHMTRIRYIDHVMRSAPIGALKYKFPPF